MNDGDLRPRDYGRLYDYDYDYDHDYDHDRRHLDFYSTSFFWHGLFRVCDRLDV